MRQSTMWKIYWILILVSYPFHLFVVFMPYIFIILSYAVKKKHTHTRGRFIDSFRDFMLPLLNLYNTKLLSPHLNIEMLLVTLFSMSFQWSHFILLVLCSSFCPSLTLYFCFVTHIIWNFPSSLSKWWTYKPWYYLIKSYLIRNVYPMSFINDFKSRNHWPMFAT